jgi:hypothetical protein
MSGSGQRDLAQVAAKYPDLFPPRLFDHAMLATIALASAYCAPWLGKARTRILNLASLWLFGLDLQAERIGPAGIDDLARRCLAVADGGDPEPGDGITELLALVRSELADVAPAFPALRPVWRDALRQTLVAATREQTWAAALGTDGGILPTSDEYLANAASTGFSMVFVTLWLTHTASAESAFGRDLSAAVGAAERVLRLVNDLGTYAREEKSGDLNVLMLGMTRAQLAKDIEASTHNCMARLRPLRVDQPRLATYVERQVGFAIGLYGVGDFWGNDEL